MTSARRLRLFYIGNFIPPHSTENHVWLYVLGRRTDGQPVLWIQRRRTTLNAPPTSMLRFDVLEEIPEIRATGTPAPS